MAQFVITAIFSFLLIVVSLVVLHEFGHYLVGRIFGLIPKAFSVGMGPELAAYVDRHGTRWKLSALPLGGYVKFAGEMHPTEKKPEIPDDNDFSQLARWKRTCIIAAGPITNLIIAAAIFLALAISFGHMVVDPTIDQVTKGSTAYASGLRPGDRIVDWNGDKNPHIQTLVRTIAMNPGDNIKITVDRAGRELKYNIPIRAQKLTDEFGNVYDIGATGMSFRHGNEPVRTVGDIIDVSVSETARLFSLQMTSTAQIISGKRSLSELSGPIRMAKMSGEQMTLGWVQLAYFAALISIAIAFMNLLPIPGLDGGYLAIYAFEGLAGRDLSDMTLKKVVVSGYAVLAMLMIFSFANDIRIVFLN